MTKEYRYLEKFVTADMAFEAFGKDLDELFENSALALSEAMVHLKTVEPKVRKEIKLEHSSLQGLLIDFLNEIIYFKDAGPLFLTKFKVNVKKEGEVWKLTAEAWGEKVNFDKHKVEADVKAATWHMLELKQKGKQWYARVVLDI
jgi:SHS2 domain-containing protein